MFHVFALIIAIANGQPVGVAESTAQYNTVEECNAHKAEFGPHVTEFLALNHYPAVVSAVKCATEDEMNANGENHQGESF